MREDCAKKCPLQKKCFEAQAEMTSSKENQVRMHHESEFNYPNDLRILLHGLINVYSSLSEEAASSCEGPREKKRYLIFGKRIIRCTSPTQKIWG
jgi:hypothetical protein